MVHLKKLKTLDATLTQLEQQANKLEETSTAYTKLTKLVQSYEEIKEKFGENSEALEQFADKQIGSFKDFIDGQEKSFGDFVLGQETTRGEFKRTLAEIENSNVEHQAELKKINTETRKTLLGEVYKLAGKSMEHQKELRTLNVETRKKLVEEVDKLATTNKAFYTDMEQSLRIKLAENKSEIKALIESERAKQKMILTEELEKQSKQVFENQKNITNVLYVIAVFLFVVSLFFLIDLFGA